jgi:hypothetical protein
MQQETSVLKNFPWGAAITPYRRDHEDTPAHTKTLPIWGYCPNLTCTSLAAFPPGTKLGHYLSGLRVAGDCGVTVSLLVPCRGWYHRWGRI